MALRRNILRHTWKGDMMKSYSEDSHEMVTWTNLSKVSFPWYPHYKVTQRRVISMIPGWQSSSWCWPLCSSASTYSLHQPSQSPGQGLSRKEPWKLKSSLSAQNIFQYKISMKFYVWINNINIGFWPSFHKTSLAHLEVRCGPCALYHSHVSLLQVEGRSYQTLHTCTPSHRVYTVSCVYTGNREAGIQLVLESKSALTNWI